VKPATRHHLIAFAGGLECIVVLTLTLVLRPNDEKIKDQTDQNHRKVKGNAST
jgi:hypothetical protein